MEISDALQSYFIDCDSRGLSSHTLRVYTQRLWDFVDFLDKKDVHDTEQLSSDLLRAFIVELLPIDVKTQYRKFSPLNGLNQPGG